MIRVIDRVSFEATVHLLVAGLLLLGVSLAGVGASATLAAGLVGLAALLFAVRDRLPPLGAGGGQVAHMVADSWIGPALAATTTAVALGASPGELQTLGGLLGLVAMANYFLRPAYYLAYSLAAPLVGRERPENG